MNKMTKDLSKLTIKEEYKKNIGVVKIQSLFRGYITRNNLRKLKDGMTQRILYKLIKMYNKKMLYNQKINLVLTAKKIRNDNFPSEITENIVKFYFSKYKNIMPNWDTKCGDLELLGKKIEVKGFMSSGPSSFGPTEKWNWIYFVDCKDTINKVYKIYEIKLSNDNEKWKNIKVSEKQTYYDQCIQKRRPRITFDKIQEKLGDDCKCVFDGHISLLLN